MPNQRPPLFPVFRVAAVAIAGGALVLALRSPAPSASVCPSAPATWAADINEDGMGERPAGEPAHPFPGQKKPPCARGLEVEYAGACWIPHERRPPCPAGLYEGEGRCLVPVKAAQRPPTSIRPSP